jgi:hypothetical protein
MSARTKNKKATVLGNRSVKELVELNWFSGRNIEGLVRRKNIVDRTNFETVRGNMARNFLTGFVGAFCREVFDLAVYRCHGQLERSAFKLNASEEENLEFF